ncbi:hypothetical protein [Paenibacillus sp. FSL H8-0034]|uniref:hypothetical protein n=1 Tax=Paenibacillus sp. FSL H8-0034 TaxID=2954671 RepID=UPI0030F653CB
MKKYLSVILLAVIVFLIIPVSSIFAADDYPRGLLRAPSTGISQGDFGAAAANSNLMADGDLETSGYFSSNSGMMRIKFVGATPQRNIKGYFLKANTSLTLSFLNANKGVIKSLTISDTDNKIVPINVENVSFVEYHVIGPMPSDYYRVYDLDVYDQVPPTPPSIPINLNAVAGNAVIDLTWTAVTGATGYNIKRSTTAGGPYTTVATNVYGSPYTDTTVTNGTTYYYVVTAVNAGGESGNSNEASATPQGTVIPPTGNRALLVVTLVSGLEKEYDLSMTEVNSFTTWYAARAAGTGAEVYTINKSFNKASFLTRKDNIAFNKIELYEVNEYTPAP